LHLDSPVAGIANLELATVGLYPKWSNGKGLGTADVQQAQARQ
jgi:hypothetical protein